MWAVLQASRWRSIKTNERQKWNFFCCTSHSILRMHVVIIILTLHQNTQRLRYGHLKKQTIEERMNSFLKHYQDRSSWTRTHPPPPRQESGSPLPPVELDVVMYKAKFTFKGQAGVVNIPIYSPFSHSFKSITFLISFHLPFYYLETTDIFPTFLSLNTLPKNPHLTKGTLGTCFESIRNFPHLASCI